MHIFVSTQETQGQRENDFCFVPEGEIVMPPTMPCTGEMADDTCGCARSMIGLVTRRATTTMKVIVFDASHRDLIDLIRKSAREAGWEYAADMIAVEYASDIIEEASRFEPGTIVEYRDGEFAARKA